MCCPKNNSLFFRRFILSRYVSMAMRVKNYIWYVSATAGLSLAAYFLVPLPHPLFAPEYSTLVVDRNGRHLRAFLNDAQQWCMPPDSGLARARQTAGGRPPL